MVFKIVECFIPMSDIILKRGFIYEVYSGQVLKTSVGSIFCGHAMNDPFTRELTRLISNYFRAVGF